MKKKKILIYFILCAIHIPQESLAGSDSLVKLTRKKIAKITHTRTTKKNTLQKNNLTSTSTPNLFKERILSSIDSGTQLKNKYSSGFGVYLILNDTNKTNSESNLYRLKDLSMSLPECLEESEKKGEEKPDTFEQPNLTSNLSRIKATSSHNILSPTPQRQYKGYSASNSNLQDTIKHDQPTEDTRKTGYRFQPKYASTPELFKPLEFKTIEAEPDEFDLL